MPYASPSVAEQHEPPTNEPQTTHCIILWKPSRRRRGLTLIEVLIATTITILMLAALAEGFKRIGDSIAENRAGLEVSNRLRGISLRLKEDLESVTVPLNPPLDATGAQGYFEYFEGPMCDYSLAERLGDKTSSDPTAFAPAARYGDFDDLLMLTSRAGNTWYTGKIPRYIRIVARGGTPTFPDDLQSEVIASQYAEIIWYARPHDDPALLNAPGSPIAYDNDLDGAPQLVKLHRRVLLIRPDLNTTATIGGRTVPALQTYAAAGTWMMATKNRLIGMHLPHQQCDLSLRRVENVAPGATFDYVAANSLEDLALRQNRFAHGLLSTTSGNASSMPLLVLENAYAFTAPRNSALPNIPIMNGALHPAFVLQDRSDPSISLYGVVGNDFYENRIGEDVIASFCVGFDLQAFDPNVPLLLLPGPDGNFVTGAQGAAGSDDIIVSPSDPGYAQAMLNSFTTGSANVAGTGAYVNLGWVRQVLNEVVTPTAMISGMASSSLSFESPFSGISLPKLSAGAYPFSDSLYRSGLFFQNSNFTFTALTGNVSQWGQMSYDTWTNTYEVDGVLQSDSTRDPVNFTTPFSGTIQPASPLFSSRNVADLGRDGIDNNNTGGADDSEEWETSPPFPTPLRSIRAMIRLEEPDTRQLFQQTVTAEFVSR